MKKTFKVTGMTCQGCVASVHQKLSGINGVEMVSVHLHKGEVETELTHDVPLSNFKAVLPDKYTIVEKENQVTASGEGISQAEPSVVKDAVTTEKSKLQQLRPLLLIFVYLFSASILLNYDDWNMREAMFDFMGLFYIVFSFFKFLDLKGFPGSFRMYDPLAKAIPVYGWVYPFLELALGLFFLMRFQVQTALVVTIVVLGITTFGVAKTLLDKKLIRCACLGTALQLPMTEATIIENTIMLVMAISMLL